MSDLAVLHAVRLLGFADVAAVQPRVGMTEDEVQELLLDFQAYGWVSRSEFAGSSGWSLTEVGRARDEAWLAQELDASGARDVVTRAYEGFLPLNAQFLETITAWQLGDRAPHLVDDLAAITRSTYPLLALVSPVLSRFGMYRDRLGLAVSMATVGLDSWVDGTDVDSLHRVWFELHEDLLATLGLSR